MLWLPHESTDKRTRVGAASLEECLQKGCWGKWGCGPGRPTAAGQSALAVQQASCEVDQEEVLCAVSG